MPSHTRSELVDFLCLILAIGVRAPALSTATEVITAVAGDGALQRRLTACGLLDPGPDGERRYDRQDARAAAIAARLVTLGADDGELSCFAAHIERFCGGCTDGCHCPADCDAVEHLRQSLAEMRRRAVARSATSRVIQLTHAIRSIEMLGDFA